MRAPKVAVAGAIFVPLLGCSTTISTLQPAEPMKPGHVQGNLAMNVNLPTSRISDAVSTTSVLGRRFATNPNYVPSNEEQRRAMAAAVGLGLSAPGANPDLMLRIGVVKNLDVGVRWSGFAAHADAKLRFFGDESSWQFAGSVGVSRALYSGFLFDVLDFIKLNEYSRNNLEVPLIVGRRLGDFGHLWTGPKYILSTYNVDASLQNVGAVTSSSGTIHYLGGFGGIALGYKYVFLVGELTVMNMIAKTEVFGAETDLGGWVVMPTGGLMMRF